MKTSGERIVGVIRKDGKLKDLQADEAQKLIDDWSGGKMITYLFKAGNQLVKSEMPIEKVKEIMKNGKVTESGQAEYPVCVDGVYLFPKLKRGAR